VTPPADEASHVEIQSVRVQRGHRVVFDSLDCSFAKSRITVLMGGSGSGKSTLLRLIGGLLRPTAGRVRVAGEDVIGSDGRVSLSVRARLGMLFQNGALLDSMSIFDNVALPLREHSQLSEAEIAKAVHAQLEAVGLEDVDELLPGELSGGMLRRAALARAIVTGPEILLCDEPFSGLDPPNVARIEALLVKLNAQLGLTLIVCSHHVASARRMAHQLMLLFDGKAITGTPSELAAHGDSRVSEFLQLDTSSRVDRDARTDLGR